MAKTSAVKISADDVLRLVDEFDNITARLWRPGFPYRKVDLERPDFLDYVTRLTKTLESASSLNVPTRSRSLKSIARNGQAKPSRQELLSYARDFDRGRLVALLKDLSRAAVDWGVDPGPFIELRGAVLVVMAGGAADAETDTLKNPAWTKARTLQTIAEMKASKQTPPRNDEPSDEEFAKGKELYDAGIATKRDQIADKLGVGDRKAGNILARIKGKRRRSPRSK